MALPLSLKNTVMEENFQETKIVCGFMQKVGNGIRTLAKWEMPPAIPFFNL